MAAAAKRHDLAFSRRFVLHLSRILGASSARRESGKVAHTRIFLRPNVREMEAPMPRQTRYYLPAAPHHIVGGKKVERIYPTYRRRAAEAIGLAFLLLVCSPAYGQGQVTLTPQEKTAIKDEVKKTLEEQAGEFAGLKWGIGISLTIGLESKSRVRKAEVVNGIVRVKEEENQEARLVLETHYFFEPKNGIRKLLAEEWGHGPFIAVVPGDDELIEAIGLGYMWGFKRKQPTAKNSSFNLGVGLMIDPKETVLADGIDENKPLPPGETEARIKETTRGGLLIMGSFTF